MKRARYTPRFIWKPYTSNESNSDASKAWTFVSGKWKQVFSEDGVLLGHVVPYRYGRGWNAYRAVDGAKAKALRSKADVEAFFAQEGGEE